MKTLNKETLQAMLNAAGNYQLLSKEEEKELAILKDVGDKEARERLINCNLRLVINEANKYNTNVDICDLIQAGNYGLTHAVDKFDSKGDTRLSTYAINWIRKYQRELIDKEIKYNTVKSYAYDEDGNEIEAREAIISLDDVVSEDGKAAMIDMVADDSYPSDRIYQHDLEVSCKNALSSNLNDLEYEILCQKLGIYEYEGSKVSTSKLAIKYSMKPAEIDKIYARAKAKLQESSTLQMAYEDYSYGHTY